MSRTIVNPDHLLSLLEGRQDWTYPQLAEKLMEMRGDGTEITPAQVRFAAHGLRRRGLTAWQREEPHRLREDSLMAALMHGAGRNIHPDYYKSSIITRLQRASRLHLGLKVEGRPLSEPRGLVDTYEALDAQRWTARLIESGQVVDLAPVEGDALGRGVPYLRPARPWEEGGFVVKPQP